MPYIFPDLFPESIRVDVGQRYVLNIHDLPSSPCRQQAFHHIVVRRRTLVFHGAVFPHDLINLIPQVIGLLGKALAHRYIGRRNRVTRGRMLRQEAILGDALFALNPARNRHGVLLQNLLGDQVGTIPLVEPIPCFSVYIHGKKIFAVFLFSGQIRLRRRHGLAFQIGSVAGEIQHSQLALARIAVCYVIC